MKKNEFKIVFCQRTLRNCLKGINKGVHSHFHAG